jgi:RNA polymerase sigma factor (sigma-70 family)
MVVTEQSLAELVEEARAGDARAFGELVERFQRISFQYAVALLGDHGLAEDACQEAFVDSFLHLHQLRDVAAFPAWLRRIVLKHADRQRRHRLLATDLGDLPGAVDPLAEVIDLEERRSTRAGVEGLPSRLRDSVALYYGSELSVGECADFLGISQSAVKKRLFDARVKLRGVLPAPPPQPPMGPRDAVSLLIATRIGDASLAASVLARRPDLVALRERWTDPEEVRDFGSIGRGYSLVQRAVFMGHREVVEVLLRAGAGLQADVGLAPLDLAALQGDLAMVRLLIEAGASPAPPGPGVLGPLHRAAMRGHTEIVAALLGVGAPPLVPGPGGRTAADWARLKGHAHIAELIEEEDRCHS